MRQRCQTGAIVPVILVYLFFFLAMGISTLVLITANYTIATNEDFRLHAQLAADGGADRAIQRVNANPHAVGSLLLTEPEEEVMNNGRVRTTFTVSVVDDADPTKYIKYVTVVGKSYSPASSTTPRSERKYKIVLRGIRSGNFSVVTGVGGLVMSNSAKIVAGNVFVNGAITMSNTAQIGQTEKPVEVRAANMNCPTVADSTYPRLCTPADGAPEPIQFSNSAHIYGNVYANNQTNGANMTKNGLQSGSVTPIGMPVHDRAAMITAVNATGRVSTGTAQSCKGKNATRNWDAGTKITGNVSIENGCTVTVSGDIWITGNLSLTQTSVLKVAEGVTTPPVIMVDGSSGVDVNNSSILASNSAMVGFRVITYWSAAACQPNCADVTGTVLKNSQGTTTISIRNGGSGPNTEFYAKWSTVSVGNSGDIGAVVGQTVNLNNSAMIIFGVSVSGSTEPSAWAVQSYQRLY